ncbi:hypothetical protein TNCV_3158801 [Trichonephila clavipes]|nr:hypothetical protein TNCV_3158801 [Trichonephila clavipes]
MLWACFSRDVFSELSSEEILNCEYYQRELKDNQVSLVKDEDNSKLLNWNLAKIIEVHLGTDDITRVVTLKTELSKDPNNVTLKFIKRRGLFLKVTVFRYPQRKKSAIDKFWEHGGRSPLEMIRSSKNSVKTYTVP